jgi:signal transduction histidine kinase/CheY-like chemotaxis protein
MFIKKLIETGITPGLSADTKRSIRLVNTLNIVAGASAFILSPLLTYITGKPIMWPGFAEAFALVVSLFLNYKKQYFLSALTMLATQNLAAVYFGILLGQGVPIQMLTISLAIASAFIFHDIRIRRVGLIVAFFSMLVINLNDFFHVIIPWSFTPAEQELIKWLADFIIFIITCITVLFFVQQNHDFRRANDNKTSFLRETNHEINKSLEAMVTTVEKYVIQASDSESTIIKTDDLKVISMAARTMSDIVRNGLNLSKIEAGKYDNHETGLIETRVWLQEIIKAYASLSLRKGLEIKINIDKNVPLQFESDRNKLMTILTNILLNAIKFSHDNSIIALKVRHDKSLMVFQITDFGKGMNPKRLAGIFDDGLYVSEKNELVQGYGVGMALTKRYVDFLDGKIRVESEEDKGTSFIVEIPVIFPELSLMSAPEISQPSSSFILSDKCVLLIEDDHMMLAYEIHCFELLGCKNIITAFNAAEGSLKAKYHVPDLIVIDVQLPDKNGLDLLKELKSFSLLQDVPFIMISSENSDVLREMIVHAGASLFLHKPFSFSELKNKVSKFYTLGV